MPSSLFVPLPSPDPIAAHGPSPDPIAAHGPSPDPIAARGPSPDPIAAHGPSPDPIAAHGPIPIPSHPAGAFIVSLFPSCLFPFRGCVAVAGSAPPFQPFLVSRAWLAAWVRCLDVDTIGEVL
jgi:hypothetical protein